MSDPEGPGDGLRMTLRLEPGLKRALPNTADEVEGGTPSEARSASSLRTSSRSRRPRKPPQTARIAKATPSSDTTTSADDRPFASDPVQLNTVSGLAAPPACASAASIWRAWGLPGGNKPRSFVRDPAGHLIEVMSAPPHPPWPGE